MAITVVHKRKVPDHIYCGRGTALGNPFIARGEPDRDKVCDQYEEWFYKYVNEVDFLEFAEGRHISVNRQTAMLKDIFNQALVGDINLGCFCAPKRCHCDTIKHFIENKLEELEK